MNKTDIICLTLAILFMYVSFYIIHKLKYETYELGLDEGYFQGYADGYLKYKNGYVDESFGYDLERNEYLSIKTIVFITEDNKYHRQACSSITSLQNTKQMFLISAFDGNKPCEKCSPPVIK